MNEVYIFLAIFAALEASKFCEGKRARLKDQLIRAKRTIKRWFRKIFKTNK